jgi:IS5 family transposase
MENLCWQCFCGAEYFVHEFPCDPTSLVKWRQRVGGEGSEQMLKESLAAAQREAVLSPTEVKRVNGDTTVQEKAVAFPT